MAKFNPFKFLQEVRAETNKVTWPSRRETAITSAMVFVFSAVAAVFFLLADQIIRVFVTFALDISGWEAGLRSLNPVVILIIGAVVALLAFFGRSLLKGGKR